MASVINSVRNIATDTWWLPKIAMFTYLIFLLILNFEYLLANPQRFIALGSLTLVLMLGSAAVMIKRNINNEIPLMPNLLNAPEIIMRAFGSIILMLPGSVLLYYAFMYLYEHPYFDQPLHGIILFIVVLVFAPFIFIPVVLYGARGRFLDGYRVDLIVQGGGDFIVKMLGYVIQYFFIFYLFSFLVYLAVKAMMGEDSSAIYLFISFVFTMSFFSFFSYISDLYEESIPLVVAKKGKKHKGGG